MGHDLHPNDWEKIAFAFEFGDGSHRRTLHTRLKKDWIAKIYDDTQCVDTHIEPFCHSVPPPTPLFPVERKNVEQDEEAVCIEDRRRVEPESSGADGQESRPWKPLPYEIEILKNKSYPTNEIGQIDNGKIQNQPDGSRAHQFTELFVHCQDLQCSYRDSGEWLSPSVHDRRRLCPARQTDGDCRSRSVRSDRWIEIHCYKCGKRIGPYRCRPGRRGWMDSGHGSGRAVREESREYPSDSWSRRFARAYARLLR